MNDTDTSQLAQQGAELLASARRLASMANQAGQTGDHPLAMALKRESMEKDRAAASRFGAAGLHAKKLEALALASEFALTLGLVDDVFDLYNHGLLGECRSLGGPWADRLCRAYKRAVGVQRELLGLAKAAEQSMDMASPSRPRDRA